MTSLALPHRLGLRKSLGLGAALGRARGGGLPATTFNLVTGIDSITFGLGGQPAWPFAAVSLMPGATAGTPNTNTPASSPVSGLGTVFINDVAISGQTLSQALTSYASQFGAAFDATKTLNIMAILGGTNGGTGNDITPTDKYLLTRAIFLAAANTGYQRRIITTTIARDDDGGTGWTNILMPLNAFLRSYYNSDLDCDGLIDFGADAQFNNPSIIPGSPYYDAAADLIHPSPLGEARMGGIAQPVITAAMQGAGTRVIAPRTFSIFDVSSSTTLSNGNRTTTMNTGVVTGCTRGFVGKSLANGGKWFWQADVSVANEVDIGLSNDKFTFDNSQAPLTTVNGVGYRQDGLIALNGVSQATAAAFQSGDTIDTAWDNVNKKVWFRRWRAGVAQSWNGSGSADPVANIGGIDVSSLYLTGAGYRIYPVVRGRAVGDVITSRFALSEQINTAPPTGYSAFGA
jgi:hypothetical protein